MTTWRYVLILTVILLKLIRVETLPVNIFCQHLLDCVLLGYTSHSCINSQCVRSGGIIKKAEYRLDDFVKARSAASNLNDKSIGDSLLNKDNIPSRLGTMVQMQACKETKDCERAGLTGYTCQHSQCICEVEKRLIESVQFGKRERLLDLLKGFMGESAYSKCHETVSPEVVLWGLAGGLQYREMSQSNGMPKASSYGQRCKTDYDCTSEDFDLFCKKTEPRRCRCKRGLIWDSIRERCFMGDEHPPYDGYLDPMRQMILPGVILITLGAMIYLGFKLFCNCGRRSLRRAPDLEASHLVPQPATWVASYREWTDFVECGFGLNSPVTSSRILNAINGPEVRTNQPLQPGLLVPDGPPTYEEALTHKVIFSSYNPTTNQAQPL